MNWALAAGILALTMYAWTRAKSYGWRRWGDIFFVVLMSIFVFGGEVWYLTHKSIPWFFGAEVEMQNRTDFNPIVLLLLLGIGGVWVLRWPLSKLANALNRTGKLPPISAVALSGFFLVCGGYMAVVGGAYNTKMSGDTPGHWAVNAERVVLAKTTGFISRLASSGTDLIPSAQSDQGSSTNRQRDNSDYQTPDPSDDYNPADFEPAKEPAQTAQLAVARDDSPRRSTYPRYAPQPVTQRAVASRGPDAN